MQDRVRDVVVVFPYCVEPKSTGLIQEVVSKEPGRTRTEAVDLEADFWELSWGVQELPPEVWWELPLRDHPACSLSY